jgi:hypothetical protein
MVLFLYFLEYYDDRLGGSGVAGEKIPAAVKDSAYTARETV